MPPAQLDGALRVARREPDLGGNCLQGLLDDVAADADALVRLVDGRAGAGEERARFGEGAAHAHSLKQLQGRLVDRLNLVLRDQRRGRQGIDELLPRHLHDVGGAAAAVWLVGTHRVRRRM